MKKRAWGLPEITAVLGVVLVLLGAVGYFATSMVSVTALIPAFFGAPLTALGALGRRPAWRKTLMHLALVLTLVGLIGSAPGLSALLQLAGGAEVARPAAVLAQSAMALLCLLHLALGIRSFVLARLSQK